MRKSLKLPHPLGSSQGEQKESLTIMTLKRMGGQWFKDRAMKILQNFNEIPRLRANGSRGTFKLKRVDEICKTKLAQRSGRHNLKRQTMWSDSRGWQTQTDVSPSAEREENPLTWTLMGEKQNGQYQITSDDNRPNDVDKSGARPHGDKEQAAEQPHAKTLGDMQIA